MYEWQIHFETWSTGPSAPLYLLESLQIQLAAYPSSVLGALNCVDHSTLSHAHRAPDTHSLS